MIAALCLALSFAATGQATAQVSGTDKISLTTTLGAGFAVDGRDRSFAWRFTAHYNPTAHWSTGVGTGISVYEKVLVPLFADVRYRIGRERLFTPFVEAAGGYSFALSSDARGGVMVNPSAGVQWRVGSGIRLLLSTGWEMQRFERLVSRTDAYFHKGFTERLNRNTVSVTVGVRF